MIYQKVDDHVGKSGNNEIDIAMPASHVEKTWSPELGHDLDVDSAHDTYWRRSGSLPCFCFTEGAGHAQLTTRSC